MNIYLARSYFYDTECRYPICVGKNKRKTLKKAVELLRLEHKRSPFPSYFFGLRDTKITTHFVQIETVPYIS